MRTTSARHILAAGSAVAAIIWVATSQIEARTAGVQTRAAGAAVAPAAVPRRALVDQYCVTCHNDRQRTAGLSLQQADLDRVTGDPTLWEKVIRKIRSGAMPPAGMPRPEGQALNAFAGSLEDTLDQGAAAAPNPGGTGVHRLNRAEYTNAIRDLLALDVDAASLLPADAASYGFDNIADVLTVSPGLMDRYLSVAYRLSRLAVGDTTMRPHLDTYEVSSRTLQDDRMGEDLPFGSRGGTAVRHYFPVDGEYAFVIGLGRSPGQAASIDVRLDEARLRLLTAADARRNETYEAQEMRFRVPVKAGRHVVAVTFVDNSAQPAFDSVRLAPQEQPVSVGRGFSQLAISTLQVDGPYHVSGPGNTPSRARIFLCTPQAAPDDEPCARKILSALARRAYRRPVTDADMQELLGFYRAGREDGGFEAGVQRALEKILVSLDFLFRAETRPAAVAQGGVFKLSDLELASRLSFFLWSSIPDDELLDAASRGALRNPAVLERHVRRMLADDRADAFVANFTGQWLYLRNLRIIAPAGTVFPDFNDSLRQDFQRESEMFLRSQVREDRSVSDLLTSKDTFLNDRLARHYGVPGITGSHFRRVTFPDDTRGGILGQAGILAVTSYPTRTSPTLRGKWVLENILGAPPPPPPPNVEGLKDKGDDGQVLSMRARMERHRKNPVCASCHAQMDPIGFALENYDAIGRWRTIGESDSTIDASGTLPNGTTFSGPAGLRAVLASRREEFIKTVTEKLLTYALGRGLQPYDMPAVRTITRQAAANDYRWSSIVLAIVRSTPFQMRRAES